jgi:DHA1 family inner membrane transport protein
LGATVLRIEPLNSVTDEIASKHNVNFALATLFLGAFVMGSAELMIVGVLPQVARDLNVSISTAGSLVTAYALGMCLGGPLLTALTIRWIRPAVLRFSLAAYVLSTALILIAPDFASVFLARAITGAMQGLFIGVAFAIGRSLVPPERMGRAIAAVIGGVAVSAAIGVPVGTWVGQLWSWRHAFASVLALGVCALVAAVVFVPRMTATGSSGVLSQARYAFAPRVVLVLLVGFLIMGGQFAALTYLAPFLASVTGVAGSAIGGFLMVYGAATAVGAFAGGQAADRSASGTLLIANVLLVVALGCLYQIGEQPWLVATALALWGVIGFGLVPSLQYRVVSLAGPGADLASTLPASAVNAGIAVGALLGGQTLAQYGAGGAIMAGACMCALAVPLTWATMYLRPPYERADISLTKSCATACGADAT